MKIVIVMPLAEQKGGAELALLHLIEFGQGLGVDWLVVFLQAGPMVARVREMGGEAHVVEAGRLRDAVQFAGAVARIARLVRRENAALLVGWMGLAQLYGGIAGLIAGVPCAWFQHGIPLEKHWIDRLATRLPAVGILACSQAVADAQARIAPTRPQRVVYPGVELARFDPGELPCTGEAKQRLGLPPAGPLIGMVGRLQRWKGMHVLVEALPKILRSYPDARVVLVGGDHTPEPDYPSFLRKRIGALGLTGKVTLAGPQSNVPAWMQAMDIVAHASDHEPFGIVVIEAMALGKPVIAGNAAGPAEIITHGVHGLLTPYGDARALAEAVLRFLDDPHFAAQAGAAARHRAHEFSAQSYAENCVAALQGLLCKDSYERFIISTDAGAGDAEGRSR